jgi:hypothetical protein
MVVPICRELRDSRGFGTDGAPSKI